MSYTEMVSFNKEGIAEDYADIKNAFRGAHAIWGIVEKRYLPIFRPSYVPKWIEDEDLESYLKYRPSRLIPTLNQEEHLNNMKEIWNLFHSDKVSRVDKIVLGTTFDKVLVKREDFKELIDAFNSFEGETSLKDQAEVIEKMMEDENIIAVGWNQNSVTSNQWICAEYDEENEETIPYNCLTGENHFWLFDDIK